MDHEAQERIDDFKTTNKTWADGRIDHEIQPAFYSFAHEKQTGIRPKFIYHILIARRGKNGPTSEEVQRQEMTATDENYQALFAKIQAYIAMLKTGNFLPANPGAWWCGSDKWCGYYWTCPYMGFGKPQKWI